MYIYIHVCLWQCVCLYAAHRSVIQASSSRFSASLPLPLPSPFPRLEAPRVAWVAWVPVEGHVANIPILFAGDYILGDYLVIRGDYQANSFCGIMI